MTLKTQVLRYEYDKYNGKAVATMKVLVRVYDGVKYNADSKKVADVEYQVEGFDVVTGSRATEIGLETDENSRDEYNEYLVLNLKNGEVSTFCNSHVDLFRI